MARLEIGNNLRDVLFAIAVIAFMAILILK
jgi:hypothetical protein